MKRTFQNHNGLIFNDLHVFKVVGGGKNGQSIVWCKHLFLKKNFRKKKNSKSKKKKFFEPTEKKRKKKKEKFENFEKTILMPF